MGVTNDGGGYVKITEANVLTTKTSRWMAFAALGKLPMIILLVLAVASGVGYLIYDPLLLYALIGLGGVYLLIFLALLLGMRKEHVELTNQRIIVKRRTGAIRKTIFIPLNHVSIYEVTRTKMGRRLGFGTIMIYASASHKVELTSLAKIEDLHEGIHLQLTKQWRMVD